MKGNKKNKLLVPILMASMVGTVYTANVRDINLFAAEDVTDLSGAQITVKGFESKCKVGDTYTLPTVTVTEGYTKEMELVDPKGSVLKNVTDTFKPGLSGTYTLKYRAVKAGTITTTTETMKIEVSQSDYAINLPTNSPYVVLSTVKTGSKIRIPAPELTRDGETDELSKLTVRVIGEDNQTTTYKGAPASGDNDNLGYYEDQDGVKYFEYTPSKSGVYEIEYVYEDAGINQVRRSQRFNAKDNFNYSDIKLSMSYSSTRPTTAKQGVSVSLPKVSVMDTNNGSSSINAYVDIKVYYRGTASNRLATPEPVKVTDYSFTPSKAGDYSVTYQARIPYFDGNTLKYVESTASTFEITDVKDSDAPSVKVVNSYKVEDDKITQIATSYSVADTGEVTENFVSVDTLITEEDLDEDEYNAKLLELLGSRANFIPSTVYIPNGQQAGVRVAIPAIYGVDNVVDGTKCYYTRSVRNESGTSTTINRNFADTENVTDGEIAYYTFPTTGTYTIRYRAADGEESTSNSDTLSYTIEVVSENDADMESQPRVSMESFSEYVFNNTTLTFSKPTASDDNDTRMEIVTKYYFELKGSDKTYPVVIDKANDDGKYELDLDAIINAMVSDVENSKVNSASDVVRLVITAEAENDFKQKGTVTRKIELINAIDDEGQAPLYSTSNQDFATAITLIEENNVKDNKSFVQRQRVYLPDVKFEDTLDSVLTTSIVVKDPNGSTVDLYNSITEYNSEEESKTEITLKDGYFVAEYAGIYQINYIVRDSGGNAVYATYGIEVKLSETPTLYLANISNFENKEYQLGDTISPPKAGLYLNGKYYTPDDSTEDLKIETSWSISPAVWNDSLYPENLIDEDQKKAFKENWELENRTLTPEVTQVNGKNISFRATVAGVYTIKYTGKYTTNGEEHKVQEDRIVKVTVKDLTTPEIEILDKEYKTFPITVAEYVPNTEVIIPGFTVKGSYDLDSVKRSVEVTGHDGKSITPKYIKSIDEYETSEIEDEAKKEYNIGEKGQDEDQDVYDQRVADAKEKFIDYHTKYAGMYSFVPTGNGTHTVYYVAVDGNGNQTKSEGQNVYVGDCEDPELDFGSDDAQDEIIPLSVKVGSTFELNMSELKNYATDNVSKIEDGTLKISAILRNSSGTRQENLFGSDETRYKWTLSEEGNYTLYITLTDEAGRQTTKEFTIESKADESEETNVKEVVGVILVVLSLAVLAGVIVYFVVTGRKMRPGSTKKAKDNKKQ